MDLAGACQYHLYCAQLPKIAQFELGRFQPLTWPTACINNGLLEGANMALSKEGLIRELKHEIHSPLAAIRNALYLAAVRTHDPETLRYLALADAEITQIAAVLKNANQIQENKQVHLLIPPMGKASAA
jgi:nitrogen-specific signal transduction histidine kinase